MAKFRRQKYEQWQNLGGKNMSSIERASKIELHKLNRKNVMMKKHVEAFKIFF